MSHQPIHGHNHSPRKADNHKVLVFEDGRLCDPPSHRCGAIDRTQASKHNAVVSIFSCHALQALVAARTRQAANRGSAERKLTWNIAYRGSSVVAKVEGLWFLLTAYIAGNRRPHYRNGGIFVAQGKESVASKSSTTDYSPFALPLRSGST